jgi:hypothetical protein
VFFCSFCCTGVSVVVFDPVVVLEPDVVLDPVVVFELLVVFDVVVFLLACVVLPPWVSPLFPCVAFDAWVLVVVVVACEPPLAWSVDALLPCVVAPLLPCVVVVVDGLWVVDGLVVGLPPPCPCCANAGLLIINAEVTASAKVRRCICPPWMELVSSAVFRKGHTTEATAAAGRK